MSGTAKISACGLYRYELTREFGSSRPLVICGLNPSTATADIDDATIRKEVGFAKLWNCGRLVKVNAYAYRATKPDDMKRAYKNGVDIVGPENDASIVAAIELAKTEDGIVLVAWGANISWKGNTLRQQKLARLFGDIAECLGTNDDGTPKHPLYIPYERPRQRWSLAA